MADTMQFDLVTPEKKIATYDAEEIVLPGASGDFAARPGHTPVMTVLRPGVIGVQVGDVLHPYAVTGGFAEVTNDRVTVLAEEAMAKADLTREEIEKRIVHQSNLLEAASEADRPAIDARINELKNLAAVFED